MLLIQSNYVSSVFCFVCQALLTEYDPDVGAAAISFIKSAWAFSKRGPTVKTLVIFVHMDLTVHDRSLRIHEGFIRQPCSLRILREFLVTGEIALADMLL